MRSSRVLVVQHTPRGGPGRVGQWLQAGGAVLDVFRPFDGQPLPDRLAHDAVVVLGGGFLPDDERAPWLRRTGALMAEAVDLNRPVLGICLGAQILAAVSEGEVQAEPGMPEHGSTPIRLRREAHDDPLFRELPEVVPAIEHHVDAITALPPDAVWLAASDRCPHQAFRLGESAWGVQFHPEVEPDRIQHWDAQQLRARGHERDELYRQAIADDPLARRTWRTVTLRFARLVGAATR